MAPTLIYDEAAPRTVQAQLQGQDLWLAASDLPAATGWEIKPEGVCRDDICIPVPDGRTSEFLRGDGGEAQFNLTAFARYIDQPLAVDEKHQVWSFGPSSQDARRALLALEAPDFTLPDLVDGRDHSLSDFRGKKVLLLLWSSW